MRVFLNRFARAVILIFFAGEAFCPPASALLKAGSAPLDMAKKPSQILPTGSVIGAARAGAAKQNQEALKSPAGGDLSLIEPLRAFANKNNSLKIHNKAIELLKAKQKAPALLLLKKNSYQNFFPPSYLALIFMPAAVSFAPLLWHIACLFSAFAGLLFLILAFKRPSLFRLKLLLAGLMFSAGLIFSGLFLLKKRAAALKETDLRSAPFASSTVEGKLEPAVDLIVLKETEKWLRVKSPDKQTGWIPKTEAFQIF